MKEHVHKKDIIEPFIKPLADKAGNHMALEKDISVENKTTKKKIRTMRGVIIKAESETKDTWTLYIFVADEDKDYLAGQFISISPHQFPEIASLVHYFEYEKGKKEVVRAYSLTSAPHEKHIAITIKPEVYEPMPGSFPPLLSPILASDILVGREIEFIGYTGPYVMPEVLDPDIELVVHLVAGSGVVPSFSIIKDELINKKNMHVKHLIIDVNKSVKDIIFHQQLNDLQRQFSHRLSVKHFLTQDNGSYGDNYIFGRPSVDQVRALVPSPQNTLFFACGAAVTKWQKKQAEEAGTQPKPRFMEWVQEVMNEFKVDKKRFKREIYG